MERFYNFLQAVVQNALSVGDTELSLTAADLTKFTMFLAGDFTRVTIYDGKQDPEILHVTAVNAETLTVLRAQEGTIAKTWEAGSKIRQTVTAASFDRMMTVVNMLDAVSGSVVDTDSAQTVSNKTLQNTTIVGGTISGASISSPVFSGPSGTLPITHGGTGAATAADARVALGIDTLVSINSAEGTLGQNDVLVVPTPGIPVADRFIRRFAQVLEETVGTTATNTTLDMDAGDLVQWEFDNTAPADALTVTDNGTTYTTVATTSADNGAFSSGGYIYGPRASCVVARGNYYWVLGVREPSVAAFGGLRIGNVRSYSYGESVADLTYTQSVSYSNLPADATQMPSYACFEVATDLFCFVGTNTTALEIWTRPVTFAADGSTMTAGAWSTKQSITVPDTPAYVSNVSKLSSNLLGILWSRSTAPAKLYLTVVSISADGLTYTLKSTKEITADVSVTSGSFRGSFSASVVSGSLMVLVHAGGQTGTGYLVLYAYDAASGVLTFKQSVSTTGYFTDATSIRLLGSYFLLAYADNSSSNLHSAQLVRGTISTTAITVAESTSIGSYSNMYSSNGAVVYSDGNKYLYALWDLYAHNNSYRYCARIDTQTGIRTSTNSSTLPPVKAHQVQSLPLFVSDVGGSLLFAVEKSSNSDMSHFVYNTVPAGQLAPWTAPVDQGYSFSIPNLALAHTDVGRVVVGNGGQVQITTFSQAAAGGAPIASSGTAASAFDGNTSTSCTQTAANGNIGYDWGSSKTPTVIGICSTVTRTYALVVESSSDNFSTSQTVLTVPVQSFAAGVTKWFDLTGFAGSRYIRIRETGGAILDLQELFLSFGRTFQGRLAYVDFANTNAQAAGTWQLIPFYSQGSLAATAAGQTAVWSQTIDTSVWENFFGVVFDGIAFFGPMKSSTLSSSAPNLYSGTTARGRGVALTATTGIFLFTDQTAGYYLKALPYSISGDVVTYGSFLTLTSVSAQNFAVTRISDTQCVVSATDTTSVKSWVLTYAANAVTAGTQLSILNNTSYVRALTTLSASAVVLGYVNSSNIANAMVLTVSGTTLASNTAAQIGSETSGMFALACVNTNLVIGVTKQTSTNSWIAYTLTISGTTITVAPATTTIGVNEPSYYPQLFKVSDNKAVLSLPCGAVLLQSVSGVITAGNFLYLPEGYNTSGQDHGVFMQSETIGLQVYSKAVSAQWQLRVLQISGLQLVSKAVGPINTSPAANRGLALHMLPASKFILTHGGTSGIISTTQQVNGMPYVAMTFDGRLSFAVLDAYGVRRLIASSKASDHGGTDGQWYYRLATNAWASAGSRFAALASAFTVAENQFGLAALAKSTEAELTALGFSKSSTGSLGLAVHFGGISQRLDLLKLDFTNRSIWSPVAAGTYLIDYELESAVRITKLSAGSKNVKGVVWRL